jgi:hypothetical protein
MDAVTFRWVLVVIALLVALAIYFYGQQQARLRRRSAVDTYTRDEIDSAFVEDEQLRSELDNLNTILRDDEIDENIGDIEINPARDSDTTPFVLPDPEIYVHARIAGRDPGRLLNYHLRHDDFRLITGEEAGPAVQQAALELDADGLLEFQQEGKVVFRIASLTTPGDFTGVDKLEFSTLGFNCFIELDDCENPRNAYEDLLKKIDELVRILNVKVYKSSQELLTISDITETRKTLD